MEINADEFDFSRTQDQFEAWDSIAHLDLVSRVEDEFNINLEIQEVVALDSPAKFVELILKKLG